MRYIPYPLKTNKYPLCIQKAIAEKVFSKNHLYQAIRLTVFLIKTCIDAFAADNFRKHCDKRNNCSYRFLPRFFQSHLLQLCLMRDRVNPFPHTTILQQTTLNVFCRNIENLHNWMDNLWLKVENIVAKGEIARFVQFLLLSLCFYKVVCCRGVRKRLYEGKG